MERSLVSRQLDGNGNANTTNLMQSLDIQPDKELKREALKYIRGNKEHACFKSLTLFLGDLINAMTDELPTMASMISVSEMSFASRKETDKKNRIKNWRRVYTNIPSHGDDNAKFNVSAFLGFRAITLTFSCVDDVLVVAESKTLLICFLPRLVSFLQARHRAYPCFGRSVNGCLVLEHTACPEHDSETMMICPPNSRHNRLW